MNKKGDYLIWVNDYFIKEANIIIYKLIAIDDYSFSCKFIYKSEKAAKQYPEKTLKNEPIFSFLYRDCMLVKNKQIIPYLFSDEEYNYG